MYQKQRDVNATILTRGVIAWAWSKTLQERAEITLKSIETPFNASVEDVLLETRREMEHLLIMSKCSIFHIVYKTKSKFAFSIPYIIFPFIRYFLVIESKKAYGIKGYQGRRACIYNSYLYFSLF